ncbi:Ig-like domain-containing protein [Paenibacillus agilis]|uniref:Tandem-95 repeat protein n=1 Tax=Paenibacillus agilis TaxID=3020863 RepID=A0A559J0U4_9BACL|nr:Ig-like domain-containing protein [Paenibacillus agilis]TVX93463.1 tandem-95 repeat protein [Paenibacillus agilis]
MIRKCSMVLVFLLVFQLVPVGSVTREVQAAGGSVTYTLRPVAAGFKDISGYYPDGFGGTHYIGYNGSQGLGKSVGALRFDLSSVSGKVIDVRLRLKVDNILTSGWPVHVDLKVASDDRWFRDLPQTHTWTPIYRESNFYNPGPHVFEFLNSAALIPHVQKEVAGDGIISIVLDNDLRVNPPNFDSEIQYSGAELLIVSEPLVNHAPVANNGSHTLHEDTMANGVLSATDPDGDPLTYSVITQPSQGAVTISNASTGQFIYTPYANVSGSDSFTFKVNDGSLDSAPATVNITINPVNDAPVAINGTLSAISGSPVNGTVTGSDVEGDSLRFILITGASKGTIVLNAQGTFTYTPNSNATGTDSFTFRANDGMLNSAIGTVMITLNPPANTIPVAVASTISTTKNTAVTGTLLGTDADGDNLTYSIVQPPGKGTTTLNTRTGSYTYIPNNNATGSDTIIFKVNDGTVDSLPAIVTVTIVAVNSAPVADDDTLSVTEDTPKAGKVTATDIDGDSLIYSVLDNPKKGTVTFDASGAFTYTPHTNATGTDSFMFKANDGTVDSNPATIAVAIVPVNDTPVSVNSTLSVTEDTYAEGILSAADVDVDVLQYSIVTQPAKGTVTIIDSATGAYKYVPNANVTGIDSFTFKANDGAVDSNTASVAVTITEVNDAPIVNHVTVTGTAQVGKTLAGNYSYADVENDREGTSIFRWYAADAGGVNKVVIPNATETTFTLTSAQKGKYITFEVTPVAAFGSEKGTAVESSATSIVAAAPSIPSGFIPVTAPGSVIDKNGETLYPENIDTTKSSITLEVAPKDGGAYVTIPTSILKRLEQKNNRFMIEIKAPYGSYRVPVNAASLIPNLQELLKANKLKEEDVSFKFILKDKSIDKAVQAALYAELPDSKVLGILVDFSMHVVNNHTGKMVGSVDQFSQSLTRLIPVPKDIASLPAQWGVFRYEESTKKFEFVPAKKVQIDGVWHASIHSYSNSVYAVVENAVSFADMHKHWANSFVQIAASKGLIDGIGNGQYAPEKAVTRAEFAAMVVRALGRGATMEDRTGPYNDVRSDAWYFNAVALAKEYGLLGFAEGKSFKPNQPITREEMASMLSAVISLEKLPMTTEYVNLDGFKDIGSVDAAFLEDVRMMVKLNIMSGKDKHTFSPKSETTRAQAAVVLVKTLRALGSLE